MDFLAHVPHGGEVFALLTALAWGIAVILFRRSGERVHPLALNLLKNLIGGLLFLPTLWLAGEALFPAAPARDYLILLASGALGIGLGDTFFFASLNRLGAGRSAIVGCLYSPFVIGLAFLFLGERISLWQFLGTALIVGAVVASTSKGAAPLHKRDLLWGLLWGILAEGAMAAGIILVKTVLESAPLVWATEVRICGGILALLVIFVFSPRRGEIFRTALPGPGYGFTIAGSIVGAYFAMFLWLAGMKYAPASIAAALNQTSTILVFILGAVFLREQVTWKGVLGVALAVGGALLVTFG